MAQFINQQVPISNGRYGNSKKGVLHYSLRNPVTVLFVEGTSLLSSASRTS